MTDNDYRRKLIMSAYRNSLKREPSDAELKHHYDSRISNAFIALHIQRSPEAKAVRAKLGKSRKCCGR